MKRMVQNALIFGFCGWALLQFLGCAEGNCRQVAAAEAKASGVTKAPGADAVVVGPMDRVKVFKYDGSLQCNMGKPVTLEEMKTQLKNIVVFSAASKMDGLMHMQVCGSPTGKAHVFEIDRHQLAEAAKLGFKEWLWN